MNKIAVIGAGPAGMMAAIAASKNAEVKLFEQNEKLGKKLYITGKGRCNISNKKDISEFFSEISRNEKFLYSALYTFTNEDTIKLFEKNGLKLKVERGGRVFPQSDKSSDVIKSYEKMLKDSKVEISLNTKVKDIKKIGDKFLVDGEEFNKVIIGTGGFSYKSTGSTGDGYTFAKNFNHTIEKLTPALVPIKLSDDFLENLQGISLKNVSLIVKKEKKIIHSEFGEMLFAHFGITGPIVLKTSNIINRQKKIKLYIDLKPALTEEMLRQRILRDFDKYHNKDIKNALVDLLPKNLIPVILALCKIDENKKINQVRKEERQLLVETIKEMPLTYNGLLDIDASIVVSGGVSTKEINPATMESKIVEGLYFCGELLDVEAFTGGFNIQIANSTGYLAGLSAST